MKTSSIGLVLSVCLLGGSSVRASIITFDQFANNGSGFFVSGVEAGYTITNGTVNNLAVNTTEPGTGDSSIGHQNSRCNDYPNRSWGWRVFLCWLGFKREIQQFES